MPKPYPEGFRQDVGRVARNRGPGVTVEQVATDFGVHPMTLWKWMRRADIEAVAHALNTRPRKTLGWRTPAEAFNEQLLLLQQAGVATTG